MNDPHNLQRFVDAQNPVFEQVRAASDRATRVGTGCGLSSLRSKG